MTDSSMAITAGSGSMLQSRTVDASRTLKAQNSEDKSEIRKSATEFEAVLLGRWLEDAEKTFASVPGSDPDKEKDPGADNFRSIGLQTLATSMANSGGIGIASMLVNYLDRRAAPVASGDGPAPTTGGKIRK
jgi:Rod binding domain-containing protein